MEQDLDYESVSLLLHQAKTGCKSSRDELMHQLQGYLFAVARKHSDQSLTDKLGTSDIVQQSMVQVINGFEKFRGSSRAEFKGWLKQILINEIRCVRRKFYRDKRDVDRERAIDYSKNGIKFALQDSAPTPLAIADASEQVLMLKDAIDLLPDDHQTVIRLRSLERLSFKDVASHMDRSPDAVTKLWYRAVLNLKEIMNADE